MEGKKLYKSNVDKKIDGVCAGIGQYFGIDPTIIRLIWIFLVFCVGTGVLAYIVCSLVMSRNPDSSL